MVLAFGGGVVGDLAGFAAAIVRRGIRVVQVPTTLLAQVDSSVGGKTGINTGRGKNLVGAFHQPSLVLADAGVLDSLPPRIFNAGYAEVAKYGLLGGCRRSSPGSRKTGGQSPPAGRSATTPSPSPAAARRRPWPPTSARRGGVRALLNLGHTFGHALEAATGYSDRLLHGEAVAIGMVLAFGFSARRGLCAQRGHRAASPPISPRSACRHGSPTSRARAMQADVLMEHIAQDKKVVRGAPHLHPRTAASARRSSPTTCRPTKSPRSCPSSSPR